jgi:hypothetical protein
MQDELTELIESADELIEEMTEELTEEVDVSELARDESEVKSESAVKLGAITEKLRLNLNWQQYVSVAALIIAVTALIFAVTGRGAEQVREEKGSSAHHLRNELAEMIPPSVNLRNIYITSYSDRVTAEILFFPQRRIESFALDVRTVLDAMLFQDVVYDEIVFRAEDSLNYIRADLSGRFSMDISVEEIIAITVYAAEIELLDDIKDIEDIDDLS